MNTSTALRRDAMWWLRKAADARLRGDRHAADLYLTWSQQSSRRADHLTALRLSVQLHTYAVTEGVT